MANYTSVKLNITDGQKEKLKHALKNKCPVSLCLNYDDLHGNDVVAITKSQAKKIAKAHEAGKGTTIRMTEKQLRHNMKVEGGFLGMLAGLASSVLPTLARTVLPAIGVGALSGFSLFRRSKSNGVRSLP